MPGRATGRPNFRPFSGRRAEAGALLREIAERFEIAVVRREHVAEIGRHLGVNRLQVDHLIALDHAQPQSAFRFKSDDLHEALPLMFFGPR